MLHTILLLLERAFADDDTFRNGERIAPGVWYYHIDDPAYAHVTVVNRNRSEFELRVMADEIDDSGEFNTQTVEHLSQTHRPGALVAVNGTVWGPDDIFHRGVLAGENVYPLYSQVMFGNVRKAYSGTEAVIGFYAAGTTDPPVGIEQIVRVAGSSEEALASFHYALGSGTTVLRDGACNEDFGTGDARSAIGYSESLVAFISTDQEYANVDTHHLCTIFERLGVANALMRDLPPSLQPGRPLADVRTQHREVRARRR